MLGASIQAIIVGFASITVYGKGRAYCAASSCPSSMLIARFSTRSDLLPHSTMTAHKAPLLATVSHDGLQLDSEWDRLAALNLLEVLQCQKAAVSQERYESTG